MLFWLFVDFVADFDFSPFDDYLLSTCSQDGTVSMFDVLAITCTIAVVKISKSDDYLIVNCTIFVLL